jgi:peroxiredoxin
MSDDQPADDRPVPHDDGAADHLPGRELPVLALRATDGTSPSLASLGTPRAVIYLYPMTATPGVDLPDDWDTIPGARGCTPEACGFRDHHAELQAVGATVVGIANQSTADQREAAGRLGLSFPLLSDPTLALRDALGLPTFTAGDGVERYRRLTLIAHAGRIEHVFYPVFPPKAHAAEVLAWCRSATAGQ